MISVAAAAVSFDIAGRSRRRRSSGITGVPRCLISSVPMPSRRSQPATVFSRYGADVQHPERRGPRAAPPPGQVGQVRVEQRQAVPGRVVPHQVRADHRGVRVDDPLADRADRDVRRGSSLGHLPAGLPPRSTAAPSPGGPPRPVRPATARPPGPRRPARRSPPHRAGPARRSRSPAAAAAPAAGRRAPRPGRPPTAGCRRRGDPAPGAVPAGRIGVAEQAAARSGQRVGDGQPRAGSPDGGRLCRAISTRTGSRSEPTADRAGRGQSAARSAPIEQVRSCTPDPGQPAPRGARPPAAGWPAAAPRR